MDQVLELVDRLPPEDHGSYGGSHESPAQPDRGDRMFGLGGDERRMHVRAYNHWVSLLNGRPCPAIADLDPARLSDFGPNSVLMRFDGAVEDPEIAFLGSALGAECGLDHPPRRMRDVPGRSLLSRLTDHYLQIVANRAPIGFEAEFTSTRGHPTMYRGILMPFSTDAGGTGEVDFIYGVISWKEMVDAPTQAALAAELDAAVRDAPRAGSDTPVWADGPNADACVEDARDGTGTATIQGDATRDPVADEPRTLGERLTLARESAAAVRAADMRGRGALYRALGRAHDFALAAAADRPAYDRLLEASGLRAQTRAPTTPVVKLVFGPDYDKTRLTEFAAVLAHARRLGLPARALPAYLSGTEGGIKAVVATERMRRRDAAPAGPVRRSPLADRPVVATIAPLETSTGPAAGDTLLLVARRRPDGALDVLGAVADAALTARAAARLT